MERQWKRPLAVMGYFHEIHHQPQMHFNQSFYRTEHWIRVIMYGNVSIYGQRKEQIHHWQDTEEVIPLLLMTCISYYISNSYKQCLMVTVTVVEYRRGIYQHKIEQKQQVWCSACTKRNFPPDKLYIWWGKSKHVHAYLLWLLHA